MYIKIIIVAAVVILLYIAIYMIVNKIRKTINPKAAKKFEQAGGKIVNNIIDNFIPDEKTKIIIKKFPELFSKIPNFKNLNELLAIVDDFLSINDKKDAIFSGFKGRMVITDDENHPLQLTEAMILKTKEIIASAKEEIDKAERLFNWFENNMSYGDERRGLVGYRSSNETYKSSEGVCGELSILFMVMARAANLEAHYVLVEVDHDNKSVNHACVVVNCDGDDIFIDPAYHAFSIEHKKFRVLSDQELVERFRSYR